MNLFIAKAMTELPFRSAMLAFDADIFADITQGSDRAESLRMAANVLSAGSSRPALYDIDSLREVMGGGRLSQHAARTASDQALQQAVTMRSELYKKEMGYTKQTKRIGQKNKKVDQRDSQILSPDVEPCESPWADLSCKTKANAQFSKSGQKGKDAKPKDTNGQSQSWTRQPRLKVSPPSVSSQSQSRPRSNGKKSQLQGEHALQDYQMQLMLLQEQNKKRLKFQQAPPYGEQQQPVSDNDSDIGVKFGEDNSALEDFDFDSFLHGTGEDDLQPSDTPGLEIGGIKYTISEDDTVPESERQSRRLIALQPPPKVLPAVPGDWRR